MINGLSLMILKDELDLLARIERNIQKASKGLGMSEEINIIAIRPFLYYKSSISAKRYKGVLLSPMPAKIAYNLSAAGNLLTLVSY